MRELNTSVNAQTMTSNGKLTEAELLSSLLNRSCFSEFNHRRDADGKCVLSPGLNPLPDDDSCRNGEEFWYERTAYRKGPMSTCEGGTRLDQGNRHRCPGLKGHGFFFWFFALIVPTMLAGLVGQWYYRRMVLARG